MLALLVRKQASPPTTDLASLPAAAEAAPGSREQWFGIYQGERKIGWAHRSTTPTAAGYRLRDESTLALAMLGTSQRLTTSLSAETDETFGLRSFQFRLVSPAATFTASGTSDGRRLDVRYGSGERQDPLDVPLELTSATRIPLRGTIASPRRTDTLTLRVSGPAATQIPDDPPRQRMEAGVLRIVREPAPVPDVLEEPPPDGRYVLPSPFIESD